MLDVLVRCRILLYVHSKKRVIDFLVSSRDVTYQSLPGRDILAGDGKIANPFLQCLSMHETQPAHPRSQYCEK
jgi:hypothetical protein